jgi:hypothetical protein
MTKAESSFRNFVGFLFYNLDDEQSPKEQLYTKRKYFITKLYTKMQFLTLLSSVCLTTIKIYFAAAMSLLPIYSQRL